MAQLSGTELETYEALYKNLGARITFFCDQVTYRGIIDSIFPDIRQVKLRHTTIVKGDHYLGNLRFKFREISSFKVVESSESVNRYPKNEYLLKILRNDRPVPNSTIAKALYGDTPYLEDDNYEEEKVEEKFVLDLPEHLESRLPKDYLQINTIDDNFFQAIQRIGREQLIGVAFHGPLVSRFGKLTWICIATDACLYFFDIQQLGEEAFDKGLRQIFESKTIKKVIHDSRFPSDCLAHQYNTHLSNVFDTRVADFVASMQRCNEEYKFHTFSSLDCCLRTYLKIPQDFLFQRETSQPNCIQETFFGKKTISNAYLYDLSKSVMYLKLLHEKFLKEMLAPFYRATGFYRTVLAKSCDKLIDDLGSDLSRPDQIPPGLLMEGIQTVCFIKPQKKEYLSLKCTFIHPQTGKKIEPSSDSLIPTGKALLKELHAEKNKRYYQSLVSPDEKECALLTNTVANASSNPVKISAREVKSVTLSSKPSLRHMDEVYHKLVNQMPADQSENIVNVKPLASYTCKFTDKQSGFNTNLDCSQQETVKNVDWDLNGFQSKTSPESCDIWAKLREEHIAEQADSSFTLHRKRNIKFVPG